MKQVRHARKRLLRLEGGRTIVAIDVHSETPPAAILAQLQLATPPTAVVAISGGAARFPTDALSATDRFIRSLTRLAFEWNIMLVDGGTASGVMQLVGAGYAGLENTRPDAPPLIGFVPAGLVTYSRRSAVRRHAARTPVQEQHPYLVMVEDGLVWGDEVDSMLNFVDLLAEAVPSLCVVVNGGLTTLTEVERSVRSGRTILLLEGTQRSVALIRAAVNGVDRRTLERLVLELDSRAGELSRMRSIVAQLDVIKTGRLEWLSIDAPTESFAQLLLAQLVPQGSPGAAVSAGDATP